MTRISVTVEHYGRTVDISIEQELEIGILLADDQAIAPSGLDDLVDASTRAVKEALR